MRSLSLLPGVGVGESSQSWSPALQADSLPAESQGKLKRIYKEHYSIRREGFHSRRMLTHLCLHYFLPKTAQEKACSSECGINWHPTKSWTKDLGLLSSPRCPLQMRKLHYFAECVSCLVDTTRFVAVDMVGGKLTLSPNDTLSNFILVWQMRNQDLECCYLWRHSASKC